MGAAFLFGMIAFWVGWTQIDTRAGYILGICVFLFFGSLAGYTFYQVESWAWVPLILGSVYVILPELIVGPADDFLAIVLGGLITGVLNWRKQQRKELADDNNEKSPM